MKGLFFMAHILALPKNFAMAPFYGTHGFHSVPKRFCTLILAVPQVHGNGTSCVFDDKALLIYSHIHEVNLEHDGDNFHG